mgnify:CR=1 FL=1
MPWTERDKQFMGDLYRIMQSYVDSPTNFEDRIAYWDRAVKSLMNLNAKWQTPDNRRENAIVDAGIEFVLNWLEARDRIQTEANREHAFDCSDRIRNAADRYKAANSESTAHPDLNANYNKNKACSGESDRSGANPRFDIQIGYVGSKTTQITKNEATNGGNNEDSCDDPRVLCGQLCFV